MYSCPFKQVGAYCKKMIRVKLQAADRTDRRSNAPSMTRSRSSSNIMQQESNKSFANLVKKSIWHQNDLRAALLKDDEVLKRKILEATQRPPACRSTEPNLQDAHRSSQIPTQTLTTPAIIVDSWEDNKVTTSGDKKPVVLHTVQSAPGFLSSFCSNESDA